MNNYGYGYTDYSSGVGATFGGSPQAYGADYSNGVSPGYTDLNVGAVPSPAPSTGVWDFLGGLAQTTMQTTGQAIGQKLSQETQNLNNRINQFGSASSAAAPATPATSPHSKDIVIGLVLLAVGGLFIAANRPSRR